MEERLLKLRIVYADIVNGYSAAQSEVFGEIFFKHANHFDAAKTDIKTSFYLNKAKSQKLPTEQEKLDYLVNNKLWDTKKDRRIKELSAFIDTLKLTKSKSMLKSERVQVQENIDESEKEINALRAEKAELIGYTAEEYARRKTNEFYVCNVVYKDKECKNRLFTDEEYRDLDENEMHELVLRHNERQVDFCAENIKKIAVSQFFLGIYGLCDNNPFHFYGKPIVELTFNQSELFGYGRYFHHVISENRQKIPTEILENPESLIDWYERSKNFESTQVGLKEGGVSTIVGATKEDIRELGLERNVIDIAAEANKKGGSLDFGQIIAIHGQ